jgi:hypothetical protein
MLHVENDSDETENFTLHHNVLDGTFHMAREEWCHFYNQPITKFMGHSPSKMLPGAQSAHSHSFIEPKGSSPCSHISTVP